MKDLRVLVKRLSIMTKFNLCKRPTYNSPALLFDIVKRCPVKKDLNSEPHIFKFKGFDTSGVLCGGSLRDFSVRKYLLFEAS